MIYYCEDQRHYAHCVAVLSCPESSIAVEVSLKIEFLAHLLLIIVLEIVFDTFVQEPL